MAGDPLTDDRFRCCCGLLHVVSGTHLSLLFYILLSAFSLFFGMKSTLTWLIVPLCVVTLAFYGLLSGRHKYLYPFLIITVVHQLVCLLMAVIVSLFAASSFDTMRQIIGHSLNMSVHPSPALSMLVICGTVFGCLLLTLVHIWHSIVIYRCLQYYEECYNQLDDGLTHLDTTFNESRWDQTDNYSSGPPMDYSHSHLHP